MKTFNPHPGSDKRTYRKPAVLDRGTVELVTKDVTGDGEPENYGITFVWGYIPPVHQPEKPPSI